MTLDNVAQVVASLDTELATFSAAFAEGRYSMWLGSAISKKVVPDLSVLLEQVLELLRSNIDGSISGCPYLRALDEVLDVAGIPRTDRASLDFAIPVSAWPARTDIVDRLIDKYADVLDVYPSGQAEDFLVWTGLDVPNTYGDPGLEPDAEHLSVAVLMLEGLAPTTQTTNWDGLIEAAVAELTPTPSNILRVVVGPQDFSQPSRRSDLVKFHGCAVRARDDEATYRPLLIARKTQISGWTTRPENGLMKERLQHVYSTSPALIIGLSAQDSNIQTIFNQAIQNLERKWPTSPPGVMVATQGLSHHTKHVLRVTYGADYAPNDTAIDAASLMGAYAKPALAGLVVFTLADKLRTLLWQVPEIDPSRIAELEIDLLAMRDAAAATAGTEELEFVRSLIGAVQLASLIFRKGQLPTTGTVPYEPISTRPIDEAMLDADYPKEALGRLALLLAVVYRARGQKGWTIYSGSVADPANGVFTVKSGLKETRVFVVHDTREAVALDMSGYLAADPSSAVVIQANSAAPTLTRSSHARYGRTGRATLRRVNMQEIATATATTDELLESFLQHGAFG